MRPASAACARIGVDESGDRAIVVGKGRAALVLSKLQSEPLGLFGHAAGSALDRLGELGGVRGGENDHRRSVKPALGARGGNRDSSVGIGEKAGRLDETT